MESHPEVSTWLRSCGVSRFSQVVNLVELALLKQVGGVRLVHCVLEQ